MFEGHIGKKFDGKSRKTPKSVWGGIEAGLNAEVFLKQQESQNRYKWLAIAAMLIALLSFTFQFFEDHLDDSRTKRISDEGKSYNSLLSGEFNTSTTHRSTYQSMVLFRPAIVSNAINSDQSRESVPSFFAMDESESYFKEIDRKSPSLQLVDVHSDIYRYHTLYGSGYRSRSRDVKSQLWAGVEAGAGNFGSSVGSEGISGGVNALSLASAVGSDGFVNPTTLVNPQMDQGLATTLGIDFGMKLGARWTLEGGLAYTNVDSRGSAAINVLDIYTIDRSSFSGINEEFGVNTPNSSRETALEVQENYEHEVDLKSNLQFTSIPVKAGFFVIDRKMSLRVNAGLAANYFVSSQLNDPSREIISSNTGDLYNDWFFDGIGGVELGYSFFDKFDFTIEPNYRYSITPINDLSSPSRFVVQTGLRYTLN